MLREKRKLEQQLYRLNKARIEREHMWEVQKARMVFELQAVIKNKTIPLAFVRIPQMKMSEVGYAPQIVTGSVPRVKPWKAADDNKDDNITPDTAAVSLRIHRLVKLSPSIHGAGTGKRRQIQLADY